jgi:hypothetical protein
MPKPGVVLGLVILALVIGGGIWVRRDATGLGSASDAEMPDVTMADGVADLGALRVTLSTSPRPPYPFERIHLRVRADAGGRPVALEKPEISFEMRMPMGEHRCALVRGDDGWLEADVVLPLCSSGDPRWFAVVQAKAEGRPVIARFQLDLAKVGSER